MQKLRRKYDRSSSCSTPSMYQSDELAFRSRNISRDTFIQSEYETNRRQSNRKHNLPNSEIGDHRNLKSNRHKKGKKSSRKHNLQRLRKKSLSRRHHNSFKDTIVLAPFHALKLCFQRQLRKLYKSGKVEVTSKSLDDTSLFRYEVVEIEAGGNKEKNNIIKGKKKIKYSRSDYCQCNRNAKTFDQVRRKKNIPEMAQINDSSDYNPPVKRMRMSDEFENATGDTGKKKQLKKVSNKIGSKPSEQKTVSSNRRQKVKKNNQRMAATMRYRTRSVTKREMLQRVEKKESDDQNNADENTGDGVDHKMEDIDESAENTPRAESVVFLQQIVRSQNKKSDGDKLTCPNTNDESASEVLQTVMKTEVNDGDDGNKAEEEPSQNTVPKKSTKSERQSKSNSDEGDAARTTIEPNVIIKEIPCESSSVDAASNSSATEDDNGEKANFLIPIFGAAMERGRFLVDSRNDFQQIRDPCEFSCALSNSRTQEDESETVDNLKFDKLN